MNKQKKQLLLMVALLVVLVGGYLGLVKYNEWNEQKKTEQAQSQVIYVTQLEEGSINKISYEYEGETISLVKDGETWVSESDTTLAIVQSTVETMAERMAEIQADLTISDATDKEQYGLGEGARKVTFSTADTTYTFFIGDYNSTSSVYYWGNDIDNTVYVVGGENVTCFNYGLEDLIEEAEESTSAE
ncbi:MAG: DUF4340 domain-containing protein [Lachnospiraceae bacterium]|nr:DUF4340 domain-containing protein [Lachnospiraceae bacterium]